MYFVKYRLVYSLMFPSSGFPRLPDVCGLPGHVRIRNHLAVFVAAKLNIVRHKAIHAEHRYGVGRRFRLGVAARRRLWCEFV